MADYLNVPGAQLTHAERVQIKTLTEQLANEIGSGLVMVNIGIMWGGTMWCLRAGCPTGKLYGIDIAPEKWKIVERDKLNAEIVKGDSRVCHNDFDGEIDVLLIDGDHHYETVKEDIEGWVPKCRGLVMFHDYAPTELNMKQFPELEGVRRAVDEYFNENANWKSVASPDSLKVFRWKK